MDREFYSPLGVRVFPAAIPAPSLYDGRWRKIGMSIENVINLRAKLRLGEEIRKSDLVISSGGGYFYSHKKHLPGLTFRQNVAHIRLAGWFKKPLLFFPQSFGPLSPAAMKLLKKAVSGKNVVMIFTREEASFDLVRSLLAPQDAAAKLDLCPDVAFLLRNPEGRVSPHLPQNLPRPRMIITLRHWDYPGARNKDEKKRKEEEYLNACADICSRFYQRWKGSVVVFPQVKGPGNFEDDRPASKTFWEKIEGLVPARNRHFLDSPEVFSPNDVLSVFSQADIALATRTHSSIMALVSGLPVVSIGYQPKGTGTLKLMGLDRFGVEITAVDPRKVGEMIDGILDNPTAVRREIEDTLAAVRKTITAKLKAALELAD